MTGTKPAMFSKVLIANRGEIAVRIIRACRDLGVSPAVVYSEADRDSLAVKLADEAFLIGKPSATSSYLRIDRIIQAALDSKAEAVHPGYGFLAENAEFVGACSDAGLVFIGPSEQSIARMGNKVESRKTVADAGVEVVPGSRTVLSSLAEAVETARAIGYPLMLKASSGGGGKGLRLVRSENELVRLYETTRSEAGASFADSSVYFERYIGRPRHIEVQILGDQHGNVIHLGERECSIQRRHQKVVEECPSPLVTPAFRGRLGEAAVAVARSVDYYSAGTIEFLVEDSCETESPAFYFLEMNTRLQVEHPVTEAVTGIDLVVEQIRIAAGEKLTLRQSDISMRGAAIECRIYAEDPQNDFLPSPGLITTLFEPSGPGVRNDSGVCAGFQIPLEYDPLISKLVAFGNDRPEAIARMRRALREYKIGGVHTTIPFFEALLSNPEFLRGKLHTHFIEEQGLTRSAAQADWTEIPAISAGIFRFLKGTEKTVAAPRKHSRWKDYGRFESRSPRT